MIWGGIALTWLSLLQASAQNRWSTWSPVAKSNAKNVQSAGLSYRTKYEMPASAAPSESVCFVQIRDDLRHGRVSTISVRVVYIVIDDNGRSLGKMLEPTVTLTNAADAVVLRHTNCMSVGSVELIAVNRH